MNPRLQVDIVANTKTWGRGLKRGLSRLKSWGRGVRGIIGKVAGVFGKLASLLGGISVALILRTSIRAFTTLERKVMEVGTLLLDWGPKVFGSIKREAQDLAIQFGQTTEAMLGARYDIVSAGFTTAAESATLLRAGVKAATAGLVDAKTATNLIISALRGYQLEAKDATRISDILFTTVRLGRTTFGELASHMGLMLPMAKAAGVNLKELGAALATVTLGGIETSIAVTAMNRMFLAMAAPGEAAATAMKNMGIVTTDATGKLLSLRKVIAQFRGKNIAQIRELTGDVRSARAVLALANNFETFDTILKEFGMTAGATETAFKKMAGTQHVIINKMKAAWAAIWQNLGAAMADGTKSVFGKLTTLFDTVRTLLENDKAVVQRWFNSVINWLTAKVTAFGKWLYAITAQGVVDQIFNRIKVGMHFVAVDLPRIVVALVKVITPAVDFLFTKIQWYIADIQYKIEVMMAAFMTGLPKALGGISGGEFGTRKMSAMRTRERTRKGLRHDLSGLGAKGDMSRAMSGKGGLNEAVSDAMDYAEKAMRGRFLKNGLLPAIDAAMAEVKRRRLLMGSEDAGPAAIRLGLRGARAIRDSIRHAQWWLRSRPVSGDANVRRRQANRLQVDRANVPYGSLPYGKPGVGDRAFHLQLNINGGLVSKAFVREDLMPVLGPVIDHYFGKGMSKVPAYIKNPPKPKAPRRRRRR